MAGEKTTSARTSWTFVTNHARVLTAIDRDPGVRLRDVARVCRLTERAVQAIVADLERAGYLTHTRSGRRNHYSVVPDTPLRHPAEGGLRVAALLDVLARAHPAHDADDLYDVRDTDADGLPDGLPDEAGQDGERAPLPLGAAAARPSDRLP
ncbi:helix-turn-helix domain-containing protein [Kitasatospora sp. NPDC093806]|uniref:helix-turn-helix transcriptional regulator n=1 Tax=Kitasatospora sp. NPDC093806 TaxID=3155075 RepID=UPI00341516B9